MAKAAYLNFDDILISNPSVAVEQFRALLENNSDFSPNEINILLDNYEISSWSGTLEADTQVVVFKEKNSSNYYFSARGSQELHDWVGPDLGIAGIGLFSILIGNTQIEPTQQYLHEIAKSLPDGARLDLVAHSLSGHTLAEIFPEFKKLYPDLAGEAFIIHGPGDGGIGYQLLEFLPENLIPKYEYTEGIIRFQLEGTSVVNNLGLSRAEVVYEVKYDGTALAAHGAGAMETAVFSALTWQRSQVRILLHPPFIPMT